MSLESLKVSVKHFLSSFIPDEKDAFAREYEDNLMVGENERLRRERQRKEQAEREKEILFRKIIRNVKRDLLKQARTEGKRETVYSTKQDAGLGYSKTNSNKMIFFFSDDEIVAYPLGQFAQENKLPVYQVFLEFVNLLTKELGNSFSITLECGAASWFFGNGPEKFVLTIKRKES